MASVQVDPVSKPSFFSVETKDTLIVIGKIALVAVVTLALVAAAIIGIYVAISLAPMTLTFWSAVALGAAISGCGGMGIGAIVAPFKANRDIFSKTDHDLKDCFGYLKTVALTALAGAAIGATSGALLAACCCGLGECLCGAGTGTGHALRL